MSISLDEIEKELKQWGKWERIKDEPNLGYPNMTPYRRLAGAPLDWDHDINHVPIYLQIGEEEALRINKRVAFIGRVNEKTRDVMKFRYIKEMSLVEIGKIKRGSLNHIGRNKAAELLRSGLDLYRMTIILNKVA